MVKPTGSCPLFNAPFLRYSEYELLQLEVLRDNVERNLSVQSSSVSIEDSDGSTSENSNTELEEKESDNPHSSLNLSVNTNLIGSSMRLKLVLRMLKEKDEDVQLQDFVVLKVLGQGAFGKVYQVWKRRTTTFEIYAMKVLRKYKMIKKDDIDRVISERDILMKLDHTFIVKLRYSYQTKFMVYFVFDFLSGGTLDFHLSRQGLFREDLARVYAAEIVSALSYIHSKGIMHRDIKPANILLDADGHIILTDFGLAAPFHWGKKTYGRCGTLEYMAPEVVLRKGYDTAADWWSFGILLFEMLTGEEPFIARSREKIEQRILKDKLKMPGYLTAEAHSLLKGLLQKEAGKRVGSGKDGAQEIKDHKWFKPINWKKLEAREIKPSFIPVKKGTLCTANFDGKWEDIPLLEPQVAATSRIPDNLFHGFPFATAPPLTKKQWNANRYRIN